MQDSTKTDLSLPGFAGRLLNSLLKGLDEIDLETKMKVMELCGETCAKERMTGSALEIAKRISWEERNVDRILERVNREILWCGAWFREGRVIRSRCSECGCPLVKNGIVKLSGTLCYCSRGWVRKVFETLLRKDIRVEIEKSIGRGDDFCEYSVYT